MMAVGIAAIRRWGTRTGPGWLAGWLLAIVLSAGDARAGAPGHGIAMHGTPALSAEFNHLPYVNPDAPKGGVLRLGSLGSFDSLNPFIIRGVAAPGLREYVFEGLLARSADEPFTLYGLLAERIEVPPDRSSATFHLRAAARFSDGRPVTVDDVIASHRLLATKGWPYHRSYYSKVARVERVGERGVRFVFGGEPDRELPLILGLMPVLASHRVTAESFDRTSLEPPVGSGPYRVERVEAGRTLVYKRDPNWWGRDLAINRGRYNFDEVRYEFFRDATSLAGAFMAGQLDVRVEDDPARWAERYQGGSARGDKIIRREIELGVPAGMSGLAFNTRRPPFDDQRVRRALILLFDAEWINRSLYHGLYRRTDSFFARSALKAAGKPADERERALLAAFPDAVRADVMAGEIGLPMSGAGGDRAGIAQAMGLLREAGYRLEAGAMVHDKTRKPLAFEFLANARTQERLILSFADRLRKAGISVRIRQVDSAQYWARLRNFDFDMVQGLWQASLSPGNEQLNRWSMRAAATEGSLNYPGVKSPAVDAVIQAMLAADTREAFESTVRALDRVLMSGDYVIPLFYAPGQWIAHWDRVAAPERMPLAGMDFDRWWLKR